jgi:hypothetical protein
MEEQIIKTIKTDPESLHRVIASLSESELDSLIAMALALAATVNKIFEAVLDDADRRDHAE